jgi:hypothetical protein
MPVVASCTEAVAVVRGEAWLVRLGRASSAGDAGRSSSLSAPSPRRSPQLGLASRPVLSDDSVQRGPGTYSTDDVRRRARDVRVQLPRRTESGHPSPCLELSHVAPPGVRAELGVQHFHRQLRPLGGSGQIDGARATRTQTPNQCMSAQCAQNPLKAATPHYCHVTITCYGFHLETWRNRRTCRSAERPGSSRRGRPHLPCPADEAGSFPIGRFQRPTSNEFVHAGGRRQKMQCRWRRSQHPVTRVLPRLWEPVYDHP